MKGYGTIARPFTYLIKKGNFIWDEVATQAIEELKKLITSTPILALPDYTKEFIVKTDASADDIGAILTQEGRPIAFHSKGLSSKNKALSVYERELLALVSSVQKWRPYLLGRHFTIKTDHHSLKYLLEKRITTPSQQKWLVKLLGYDYTISYKKGKENTVADALSRREDSVELYSIFGSQVDLLDEVKNSWEVDPTLKTLIAKLQSGSLVKRSLQVAKWHFEQEGQNNGRC